MEHVILEVTESVFLGQRNQAVADQIKALRASGMRLALDDFGTGFASLTHLLTVSIDILKIDRTFVERLVPGDGAVVVVEGLLASPVSWGFASWPRGSKPMHNLISFCRSDASLGRDISFRRR